MSEISKNSIQARRETTENRLLDALEVVLVRDGIRRLNLKAVLNESGVSKPLLYRYFGSLQGLLTAWVERRGPQPAGNLEVQPAQSVDDIGDDAFLARVAEQLVDSAERLREQPILLEMLAEELTANSDLSEPFQQARRQQSTRFVRAMLKEPRYTNPVIRSKIILLIAAINYAAMRARRSPRFMGIRLDTRKGWNELKDMIRTVVQL